MILDICNQIRCCSHKRSVVVFLLLSPAVTSQLIPTSCFLWQTAENEEALGQLLQQMGVQNGQNISFENFWTLINKQAIQMFGSTHKEKNIKCGCLLQ